MNFIIILAFYSVLFLRPVVVLSSSNIIVIWIGLELRTFSFLPMIFSSAQSSFSTSKYFFVQRVASVIILASFFTGGVTIIMSLVFVALILKLGLAPLHFWLPGLVSSLQVKEILILLVWQKIGPLAIIVFIPAFESVTKMMIGVTSAFVGRILGLKQTQWKQIFTFSSVSHLGWLLVRRSVSFWVVPLYFFIYAISFIQLIVSNRRQFINSSIFSFSGLRIINLLILLSLAGLPPILGFFAKITVLLYLTFSRTMILVLFILISSSLLRMFFYLKIFFSLTLNYSNLEINRRKIFFIRNLIVFFAFPLLLNF